MLKAEEVRSILDGRELQILELIRSVYKLHDSGFTALPHSTFLPLPNSTGSRIIALPAYVGGDFCVAGIKWVASAPENLRKRMDRATAVVVVNDPETGRPLAVMEGSHISAARTAASAVIAAQVLSPKDCRTRFGLIGCGRINFEVVRFLRAVFPLDLDLCLFDLYPDRAARFKARLEQACPDLRVIVSSTLTAVFEKCNVVSLATTSTDPYIRDLPVSAAGSTILHISLRDLSSRIILSSDNVVDDVDHVCRAQTSIHLAAQECGHRDFIRCTLGEILTGSAAWQRIAGRTTIFSPFGLGILDIALAKLVMGIAVSSEVGMVVPHFLPQTWWCDTNEARVVGVPSDVSVEQPGNSEPRKHSVHEV